ncbi:OmpA family protein [Mariniflexile litorale]|uniref:OmpA family protein n=1 Tax=Mariniflexile litorale TaxID=3045158 RepID=A0AAU7EDT9_9FLAO|nr:OmpA family protein [Mariniflexile sp. KMM 9835]MDQ8213367.1 OmpA family protein [Mariniflexile sp. KMM 9835]
MKLKIIIALSLFYTAIGYTQEFTLKMNGGLSGILYDDLNGEGKIGFGGGLGVGYTYFLNNHWGVVTGVDVSYNQNQYKLNANEVISTSNIDDLGSAFFYNVKTTGYKEDQSFLSVAIPLMLQYRTVISNNTGFYIGFGGKFLIPAHQKISASSATIATSAYYPDLNLEIDDLPNHGFGLLNNWDDESSVSLKPSVLLSMESGLSFSLKKGSKLYTGVYADYGLTDLQDHNSTKNLVTYSPNGLDNIAANGILAANNTVKHSKYLSAGIQIKWGINFKEKNKKEELVEENNMPEEIVIPTPIEEKEPIAATPTEEIQKPTGLTSEDIAFIEKPLIFGVFEETTIPANLENRLNKMAVLLVKNEKATLNITGYTCNLGSKKTNKKIGLARAASVAEYLNKQGVATNRMKVASEGEASPLTPNTSHENRAQNRRVSMSVLTNNE